jgi:beta-galactosidase
MSVILCNGKHFYVCVIYVDRYVEWSQHEPSPGHFEFSGELDLQYFIQLAQEEDLLVLLRPGPYICAERDMVRISATLYS